jgi:hypothetical protein
MWRAIRACGVALGLARAVAAQRAFDGVVTYHTVGLGPGFDQLVVMERGSRVRVETRPADTAGPVVRIIDYGTGRLTTLFPGVRRFSQTAVADQPRPEPLSVRPTGRRETIAGLACDVYDLEDGSGDACVAQELGHCIAVEGSAGIGGDRRVVAVMRSFKEGAVPLRIRFGRQTYTAIRVEQRTVSDDQFQVPANYTETR